ASLQGQMLAPRQQRILLPLDELTVLSAQAGIFAFPHLVQSFGEVTQHVELVEHNLGLRGMSSFERRGAKGLPHIHYRHANALALLGSQPRVEPIHTLLRPILSPEPEYAPPRQVADDDAVSMPLANRNLVDADALGARGARPARLLAHVLLVQLRDRLPIQAQLSGDIAQSGRATPPPDHEGEAFGIEGVGGQPGQLLLLHGPTVRTPHAPDLDLQINPRIATGEVAHSAHLVIVERPHGCPTDPAACFFPRRTSPRMRALGSPKTPRTVALGRKAGKRYVSTSRSGGRMRKACHVFSRRNTPQSLIHSHFPHLHRQFLPTRLGEDPEFQKDGGGHNLTMISIIDDDESVRGALHALMRSVGFAVNVFASAEEFLASDRLRNTDCLILDVRLPGMSGLELQRHLETSHSEIPIIFITSYEDDEVRARALNAGAVDYFLKPFNDEDLLDAIEAVKRK